MDVRGLTDVRDVRGTYVTTDVRHLDARTLTAMWNYGDVRGSIWTYVDVCVRT